MSYDHSLVKPLFVAANLVLYKLNESFDEFMRLLVYVMILLHTKIMSFKLIVLYCFEEMNL